ncbi:predicted AMP-activated protein kinase beta subunit [Pseudozyma hubeiensis SY62]|uniref:Predicted AMP-activated protein kinase beta subunit n=1 Tax=Pseudozyma hubeiensis (strain SY62) TaxID=1305764 RepID=R9PMU3_PSEHS|nr:predicted AMP-activated protein kinase beta subunit [Pseudozyma hubeiensis SY62]GAC99420.1 predicted AMP-activated protein kinase beta subunit [Pseudozyma hubeiensis SY62]
MGNANSTAANIGDASAADTAIDPAIKRYHSHQAAHAHSNGAAAAHPSSAASRQISDRQSSGTRLGRTASIFGRASSHDGATTPQRNRSRSGSLTGFLATQRRGSTTAATTTADAYATVKEGQEPPLDTAPSTSSSSPSASNRDTDFASYEISNPAPGSGIETAIRANPRTRRLTEGLALPPSPGNFDPRHYVSPHPSPSVATQAHYAAGLPSHHVTTGVSSGLRVSSTGFEAHAVPATTFKGSEPQHVPNVAARAPTRHPLFGVGGTSLFPNVGTSVGTNPTASPPIGGSSPVLSSQPLITGDATDDAEGPQRLPAALPSYLKIPTAIPSSHVHPSSPPASIYSQHSDRFRPSSERQRSPSPSLMHHHDDARPSHIVAGAGAAAAVLNTEDVVIPPGDASKASSPTEDRGRFFAMSKEPSRQAAGSTEISVDEARAAGIDVTDLPSSPATGEPDEAAATTSSTEKDETQRASRAQARSSQPSDESAGGATGRSSREPTPTPSSHAARAQTPTRKGAPAALRSLSPAVGPSTSSGPPTQPISARRSHVDVQTGGESGYNTPLLPPGLTSAPPSASIPGVTPLSELSSPTTKADRARPPSAPRTPSATGSAGHASQPTTPVSAKPGAGVSSHHAQAQAGNQQPPLMPIVLTWRAGGREVFVTGTFANEWRSKILLHKSKRDHTCVLHLPPGTHRLKFIVDDRWRVSRDLPTATDGDGNLVNYVEIPNVGPAHPGPLSAPGEDLPGADADNGRSERNSKIESKKTTMNLIEEARKAEAMRLGLDDLFDDDGNDQEETWTSEIPTALIEAQEAEEAQREAEEDGQAPAHAQHGSDGGGAVLPLPPALPRQLEKVILNSSPANPSNGTSTSSTVDDNSILPAPNHVVLNHLTASSIKGGVLAVGTTTRYKRKYVTTVYYRPVQV